MVKAEAVEVFSYNYEINIYGLLHFILSGVIELLLKISFLLSYRCMNSAIRIC